MEVVDRWDDISGEGYERYLTIELDNYDRVDVKRKEDGFTYIMQCANGYEVYKPEGNEDGIGYRYLDESEQDEVMDVALDFFNEEDRITSI